MKYNQKFLIYLSCIIAIWTSIVGGSYYWNLAHEHDYMESLAKKDAIANFNNNMSFRSWASMHGGVYVKKDSKTPSNPNLANIPERDIVTPSGVELTMMNPAYMMRQLMNEFPKEYGVKGRIVSDKPLWKPNAPDTWEADAIAKFKKGAVEKFEFTTCEGKQYLRLMRPVYIEQTCLKCHGVQGYKVGDVRGGIGVLVDMKRYLEEFHQNSLHLALSHFIIYISGLFLILFGGKKIGSYLKRLEEEQQKVQLSHVQLELTVQERTQELKDAYEKLKELDKVKTMFIASMSHELRTPLNAIIGFSGLLLQQLEGPFNERQIDHLTRINKTGKHLYSLITDVMDVSQMEAGCINAAIESFTLEELSNEVIEKTARLAAEKGIEIVVDIPQGIELKTDKKRLMQCVLNYLKNAINYSEKGVVTLRVSEKENRVALQVEDQGIGIATKDQNRLFQPFERIDSRLSVIAGGTGLGLYLTKKIVTDLLGGTVGVESAPEKGSKFWLEIPKKLSAAPEYKGEVQ